MRTIISGCTVAFLFCFSGGDLAYGQQVETYDLGTYSEIFELNPPAVFSIVNGQGLNGTRGIQPLNTSYTINYLRKGPFDLSGPGATLEISTFFKVSKPTSTNLGVATLELGFAQDETPTSFISPYQTGTISWWLQPKSLIDTGAGFQFETTVYVSVYNGSTSAGFGWGTVAVPILKSNNWYKATLQISRVNSTTLSLWGMIDDYGPTGQTYLSRVDTVGTSTAIGSADYPFTPFTADSTLYPALHGMSSGGLKVVDQTAIMGATSPGGAVLAWGKDDNGQTAVPAVAWSGVTAVAAGDWHTVALKTNGTVLAWGHNYFGQTNVPTGLGGVTAIAGGGYHTAALKTNGTVVAWGDNEYGQTNVPVAAQGGVAAIAAGHYHTVALKTNGAVVAWGLNNLGQTNVPVAAQSGVTAIAAGNGHTVALKANGTVVAWGYNSNGETNVPAGLSGAVAVAAGGNHTLALRNNGTVVAWGYNYYGQTNVPIGLSGVVAIAAGDRHSVALKTSGAVVAWGYNYYGQTNVPVAAQSWVTAIAAGYDHTVVVGKAIASVSLGSLSQTYNGSALSATATTSPVGLAVEFTYSGSPNPPTNVGSYTVIGTINDPNYQGSATGTLVINPPAPVITTQPQSQTVAVGANAGFNVVAGSVPPFAYQWAFNGTNLSGETRSSLNLVNVQLANAGYYQVRVTNVSGWAFSLVANLSVIAPLTNSVGSVGAPVGLLDWWPAEGNANDMAGPNNGTPTNAVSYVPGQVGLAFSFDGSTSAIIVGASNIPPPWTACFWVNRQSASGASAALTASSSYALKLEQFNLTRKVGITEWGVADYAFNYVAPLATWVHLVFVGTGSNTSLYANGVFQDSLPVNVPLPRTYLGAAFSQARGGFFNHLQGSLDEISLFSRALSASEIQYIFSAGNAGFHLGPGMVVVQLGITRQGGNVQLNWPAVYSNYNLLSSAALIGGAWITDTSPRTVNGSNIVVPLAPTSSRMFYRIDSRQ